MTDDAIVPVQQPGAIVETSMAVTRPPELILEEAMKAAKALKDVVSNKEKPVVIRGKQYLEFEDWQTVGRFYGLSAAVEWTRLVDIEGVRGFEARAQAIDAWGNVISAAESMCLNDEDKWSTRPKYEWKGKKRIHVGDEPVPLFQLRSMAQTRACAKALRNALSWVVVLAGYQATPAEELDGTSPISQTGSPDDKQPSSGPVDDDVNFELVAKIRELGEAIGKKPGAIKAAIKGCKTVEDLEQLKNVWGRESTQEGE